MFLFNSVEDIKDNSKITKDIFSHPENLEIFFSILMFHWNKQSGDNALLFHNTIHELRIEPCFTFKLFTEFNESLLIYL